MDATHFDRIARMFAARRLSRRSAVRQGGAGLAAATLAATGLRAAAAQDASPAARGPGGKTEYLFVQSFESGSIVPKAGEDGTYTLTLDHGLGQTLYFSDRPERVVGAAPTPAFLKGLGFSPNNPPNAALVVEAGPGNEDIAVVELTNPSYDEGTKTATYDAKVLQDWERTLSLGFAEAPTDLAQLAPAFGAAHLFIDDCPDLVGCVVGHSYQGPLPSGRVGQCWSWASWTCAPDNSPCGGPSLGTLNDECNRAYSGCEDACSATS
jgi:hypothetical protein